MHGLYGPEYHIVEMRGHVTMRDNQPNKQKQTSEDRTTQPMDAGG